MIYVPGSDPFHARRCREHYRKEAGALRGVTRPAKGPAIAALYPATLLLKLGPPF